MPKTPPQNAAEPDELRLVTKRGNTVSMPVETFDGLIERLLDAESRAAGSERSWWRP